MTSAAGVALTPDNEVGSTEFMTFAGARLEWQFIYNAAGQIVTVNIHAFDRGTSCEYRGTATVAAIPAS